MQWRLLDTPPATGAWNMAVDEVLMEAAAKGQPTLRFYRWQPAAVSIGYFQRLEKEVDQEECKTRGFDVVRRLTGGRAVLHHNELTYSVSCPETLLPGNVLESYKAISAALLAGLQTLGVLAFSSDRKRSEGDLSAACFDTASWYEITDSKGRKLVGSAQTRKHGAILQHGSLLIKRDIEDMAAVVPLEPERRALLTRILEKKSCSLEDLGHHFSWEQLTNALTQGFRDKMGIELVPTELTTEELQQVETLIHGKYACSSWTGRR